MEQGQTDAKKKWDEAVPVFTLKVIVIFISICLVTRRFET